MKEHVLGFFFVPEYKHMVFWMVHFIGARPVSRSSRVLVFHSIVSHLTLGTTCGAWRSAQARERLTSGVTRREEAGITAAQSLPARYPCRPFSQLVVSVVS